MSAIEFCGYCHGHTYRDKRGNCSACGAPKPEMRRDDLVTKQQAGMGFVTPTLLTMACADTCGHVFATFGPDGSQFSSPFVNCDAFTR